MTACGRTSGFHTPDRHNRAGRRWLRRYFAIGFVAVLLALVGCKSKEGSVKGLGGGGGPTPSKDPLVVGPGRIPKQNLPVPDRGTAGAKGREDPLLGSPTSRPGGERTGAGYTDDPERWKKGPYIPGPGSTPASLAGRPKNDDDGLKIEGTGGTPLTPAGGRVPADLEPSTGGAGTNSLYTELARYGVKRGDYSHTIQDGQYLFQVRVPISGSGATRQYNGVGASLTDAIQQVIDQLKVERGR